MIKKLFKKIKFTKFLLFQMLFIVFIFSVINIFIFVFNENSKLKLETSRITNLYIKNIKTELRTDISGIVNSINYEREKRENKLKKTLLNRLNDVIFTIKMLYKHKNSKKYIIDSLNEVNIHSTHSQIMLLENKTFITFNSLLNKDVLNINESNIKKDLINNINETNNETISFNLNNRYLAAVKKLEFYNWTLIIFTNFNEFEKSLQKDILKRVEKLQISKGNYVFAGTWDGISLCGPQKDKNMLNLTDVNGIKIVQELIKAAKNSGGFIEYYIPKFKGYKSTKKFSYAKPITDWKWYIGSGIDLIQLENRINQDKKLLKKKIKTYIIKNIVTLLIFTFIIILIIFFINTKIKNTILSFTNFFKEASEKSIEINKKSIYFKEFNELSDSANEMVEKQWKTYDELINLNYQINKEKTKVEELNIRAEESNRAKSLFLAIMSHELRTPLNSIIGFSNLISTIKNQDKHKYYAKKINNSGIHLLSIINKVLNLSKIESGNFDLNISNINIKLLSDDIITNFEPQAMEKNLKLNYSYDSEIKFYETDRNALYQVITNIISNAIKFTDRGEITYIVENDDEFLYFKIEDTGIGIKQEKLDAVFERFVQVDNSFSRKYEGTGLGLSISKALIESINGEIFIESEEEKGTIFTIKLQLKKDTKNKK